MAFSRCRSVVVLALAISVLVVSGLPVVSGLRAEERYLHPNPDLDLTERYLDYRVADRFDRPRIEKEFLAIRGRLKPMRILVVPSWLSDTARAAAEKGLFDFLGDQVDALREAGITVEMAKTDSEGAIADNAPIILRQIARSREPVCLLTHSKGGLDALDALLRADKALVEKVRCWVALQSPFAGSPLADLAEESWVVRNAAGHLLPALGGSAQSLTDLTIAERRRYLAANATKIAQVLSRIRVLCFAGHVEGIAADTLPAGVGAEILSWALDRETPSDGLVPVKSSILPGTHYIVAKGVDHSITVTSRNPLQSFDRVLFLKALLVMVMGLPENPPIKS